MTIPVYTAEHLAPSADRTGPPSKTQQATLPRTIIVSDRGAWAVVPSWFTNHDAAVAGHVAAARRAGHTGVTTRTVTPVIPVRS